MLTRELLNTGAYYESFRNCPDHPLWSRHQIQASMYDTLARRPEGPVWLFTYGSLIWNPLFNYRDMRRALLDGWQRSFCIRLIAGRGTAEHPGRMLALEAGGKTEGVAYMLEESDLDDELGAVWLREMIGGVYQPRWERVSFGDGSNARAIVFVANPTHPLYESDSSVDTIAPAIARASGTLGRNADYATQLLDSLVRHGMSDPYIDRLVARLDTFGGRDSPV